MGSATLGDNAARVGIPANFFVAIPDLLGGALITTNTLPEDVINQTINAFNVSATAASGYGGAAPTGKYFAPANGPDCIEVDNGANYGNCAEGSIVLTGPLFQQYDMRLAKKTKRFGSSDFELPLEALNVFHQANFVPVGIGSGATQGNTVTNYEVTALTGTNTARGRALQLVALRQGGRRVPLSTFCAGHWAQISPYE